ncbi:unnamed protein product [Dibothriocephalus latus]|uniref:Uncharacterized protein n=1 Tax=Dibothriocephalus latus TaxID=60516 RepID=A0A3P7LFS0_DIBLA|nr:unnamed protein product [Dibothriocephalus latus]
MSIRTFSGPVTSPSTLTKQQYIELAAIPSGPLGSGRSRPLVPWTEPSAPVPSPTADMLGEFLSVEEDPSGLGKEKVDKSDGSVSLAAPSELLVGYGRSYRGTEGGSHTSHPYGSGLRIRSNRLGIMRVNEELERPPEQSKFADV